MSPQKLDLDPPRKKKKSAGAGCLVPFGSVFFLAGMAVLIFGLIIPTIEGWNAKSWPTVQGTLLENTVRSHSSSDGTSYSHELKVEFAWQGQIHTTERPSVYPIKTSGEDALDSQKKALDLQVRNKGTVTVWVKESDPAKSIISPSLSWKATIFLSIFGSIFALIGFGIMISPFLPERKKASPDDEGFRLTGPVKAGFPMEVWVYAGMGIIFTGVGLLVVPETMKEIEKENYLFLLVYLFPLAGLWTLWLGIREFLRYRKFGSLEITFDPQTPRLGNDIIGRVTVPIMYDPTNIFKVNLGCYMRRKGNQRSENEGIGSPQWMEEGYATTSSTTRGTELKFAFALPKDQQHTHETDNRDYSWRLFIEGDLPGFDLERTVEIPVAPFDESAPSPRGPFTYSRDEAKLDKHEELPRKIVQIGTESDGSARFHFPASRNRGAGIGLFIIGAIFGGSGVGVGYFVGLKEWMEMESFDFFAALFSIIPMFMGIIFTLIGLALLIGGIVMMITSLTLVIDRNGTLIQTYRYLIFSKRTTYLLSTLSNLRRKKNSSSTGSQGKTTITYQLLVDTEGKKIKMGDGLKGTQITDAVEDRLREALNKAGASL